MSSPTSPCYSSRPSSSASPVLPPSRRQSTISCGSPTSSSATPTSPIPRVQLVPYVHRLSFDSSLSQSESDILDNTSFDELDLSSQDFDFEDLFTYDKPQRKLAPVVEVSSSSKDKNWNNFSFSHYTTATTIRQKANRGRSGIGEMYVKNKNGAQKR